VIRVQNFFEWKPYLYENWVSKTDGIKLGINSQ